MYAYMQDAPDLDSLGGNCITTVSEQAHREAGAWPNVDSVADRILTALQAAVDNAPEGEPRSRAKRALEAFGAAGRDFLVDVASGVTTGAVTSA